MKQLTGMAILLASVSVAAPSDLNLKPVHPDEPVEYTFNQRLSIETALKCVDGIASALDSFRKLTDLSKGKISKQQLKKVGNTGAETQTLAFANMPGTVKGTLLKQDYLIQKLQYELVLQKSKTENIEADKLAEAEGKYRNSEAAFLMFWNSFGIAD